MAETLRNTIVHSHLHSFETITFSSQRGSPAAVRLSGLVETRRERSSFKGQHMLFENKYNSKTRVMMMMMMTVIKMISVLK